MLDITKVVQLSGDDFHGELSIEPLESGQGHTLGNSLRRVLLNNLPGAAVTAVRIKGAPHQFMSLPGMKEDVVDLTLNIKKLRFRMHTKDNVTIKLSAKGGGEVTAAQIGENAQVEVINKELVLCHLADEKSSLNVEMTVSAGVGYESVEDRTALNPDEKPNLGEIQLDALYSPIVRVNYKVENTRVGRITNYDRLVFEITTDGTISGFTALRNSAQILTDNFAKLANIELSNVTEVSSTTAPVRAQGKQSVLIEELDLPPKIANRLKENGFATADDVIKAGRDELLKMSNFGEKSLKELEVKLVEKGYSLE